MVSTKVEKDLCDWALKVGARFGVQQVARFSFSDEKAVLTGLHPKIRSRSISVFVYWRPEFQVSNQIVEDGGDKISMDFCDTGRYQAGLIVHPSRLDTPEALIRDEIIEISLLTSQQKVIKVERQWVERDPHATKWRPIFCLRDLVPDKCERPVENERIRNALHEMVTYLSSQTQAEWVAHQSQAGSIIIPRASDFQRYLGR